MWICTKSQKLMWISVKLIICYHNITRHHKHSVKSVFLMKIDDFHEIHVFSIFNVTPPHEKLISENRCKICLRSNFSLCIFFVAKFIKFPMDSDGLCCRGCTHRKTVTLCLINPPSELFLSNHLHIYFHSEKAKSHHTMS